MTFPVNQLVSFTLGCAVAAGAAGVLCRRRRSGAAAERERRRSEEEIRRLNAELESRVAERTAELALVNQSLTLEIQQRKQAQEEISWLAADLELQKEALEAANHELESFSSSVSHDLRAPLRHAKGFSQAFLEDFGETVPPEGVVQLERVVASCARMESLIDDLLKLARVTRAGIHCRSVNLSDLAREVAEELRQNRQGRHVEFVVSREAQVFGDEHLLRIALENLVGNAWKYTGKRDGAVVEFGVRDGEERVFFVRDNGVGFDMAHADRLFNPFQRLHNQADFDGTGIGLATVQRIVHRHGGRIWAESAPDAGATFFFTL
ncbi:sensor histidine kinase [Geobacter pickeringii]|uniref:sensor histidine kinase n=1 Tax=Geobacter pickeringii TaxID=345632 RepID=UPI00068A2ACD|nr:ATP-binding protein [Geobacter pickeringii]